MINLFEKLLNLIYYRTCCFCGIKTETDFVCSSCYKKIRFINALSDRKEFSCPVYVCSVYEKVIKKLILGIKYSGKRSYASFCAGLASSCLKNNGLNQDYIVIPVPVHKNRKRQRKYNHMDLIADIFARNNNLKCSKNLIVRVKDTERQFNLDTSHRIKNIKDAFALNYNLKSLPDKNSSILIIDDIVSSGATINEITSVLNKAGYFDVTALVLSMPELNH